MEAFVCWCGFGASSACMAAGAQVGPGKWQGWMPCVCQNGRSPASFVAPRLDDREGSAASGWARGSLCATRAVSVSRAAARRADRVTDTSSGLGDRPPPTDAGNQGGAVRAAGAGAPPGDEEAGDAAVLLDADDVDDVFGDADALDRDDDARPVWARAAAGIVGLGLPYAGACHVSSAVVAGAGQAPARPACMPCGRQTRHCHACHEGVRQFGLLCHVSIDAAPLWDVTRQRAQTETPLLRLRPLRRGRAGQRRRAAGGQLWLAGADPGALGAAVHAGRRRDHAGLPAAAQCAFGGPPAGACRVRAQAAAPPTGQAPCAVGAGAEPAAPATAPRMAYKRSVLGAVTASM
jgi:hypothetical protein